MELCAVLFSFELILQSSMHVMKYYNGDFDAMPLSLYPRKGNVVLHSTGLIWMGEENLPLTGIWFPDSPVHSEAPYRQSHPTPMESTGRKIIILRFPPLKKVWETLPQTEV
jgi:hypothetical protein